MGQQPGKEGKGKRGAITPSGRVDSTGRSTTPGGASQRVRPSAMNDALISSSSQSAKVANSSFHSHGSGSCTPRGGATRSVSSLNRGTSQQRYPIVLRYQDKDVAELIKKKANVSVLVESLDWKPLPMTASEDSFYAITELHPGEQRFRFTVNGSEVVDSTQTYEKGKADGLLANTVLLNDVILTTKEDDDLMDDGTGWGQDPVIFEESRKYPPIVPVHLRYTPLNTPPTLVRCTSDGLLNVQEGDVMAPEHLPLPLSVTINHVYFQRREDHAVMGVTTRYCNKFTTVVYYKHMQTVTE